MKAPTFRWWSPSSPAITAPGWPVIAAVEEVASGLGLGRLSLITTNDNVDALRFYQRRGFRFAAIRAGAVDDSRADLKPEIPTMDNYGIPIHDEIIPEKHLLGS
ncbi:GNAT family N-acetyltransferase [Thermopolyspora sp. NPDC052614]|uniref:GNAT family N-acetyltransferase n=1 Tax=Thermopolyspora sp. NPDC052614 TaxID=3155682 RepID=UPI003440680E